MTTLVLSFQGPLQSWGLAGRFNTRDTHQHPTKSATIGLLRAALGHTRDAEPAPWAQARFTCRIDNPGRVVRDYHTIGDAKTRMPNAEGKRRDLKESIIVTDRWYLADASFTVCLEYDTDWSQQVAALEYPAWQPYLGRRSCVPVGPLAVGTTQIGAAKILRTLPLLRDRPSRSEEPLRVEMADDDASGELVADQPNGGRRFLRRPERVHRITVPVDLCSGKGPSAWEARQLALEVANG